MLCFEKELTSAPMMFIMHVQGCDEYVPNAIEKTAVRNNQN